MFYTVWSFILPGFHNPCATFEKVQCVLSWLQGDLLAETAFYIHDCVFIRVAPKNKTLCFR